ncbi:MAG: hypothetical protein H6613_03545 [Ignavibacteriales bacterium]|nr:hypothetical protein [Ignavibacteriales bacterium]
MSDNGNIIEVSGQKSHTYTFEIKSDDKPNNIVGADNWVYDSQTKQIIISKKGKGFKFQIE